MGYPVVHFEIMGGKNKETEQFYATLFDWKIDSNNEWNYGLVDTNSGSGIAGGVGPAVGPQGEQPPRVSIYVQVPDINTTLEHATKLGAEVLMERTELPGAGVTLALFKDPNGNITGLTEG